jgi:uncharacterized protein (DUF302 family)
MTAGVRAVVIERQITNMRNLQSRAAALCVAAVFIAACGSPDPVAPQRYAETDAIMQAMQDNLSAADALREVVTIDHSRLGHAAGSPMPPSRVLMVGDVALETALLQLNPLVGLDLPLRILTFEDSSDGSAKVIYNAFDYVVSRYQLDPAQTAELRQAYDDAVATVTQGLPAEAFTAFDNDAMQPDGIVTIPSPYGFAETLERVNMAIDAQDDTMHFGAVDFQANAQALGVDLPPAYLILFGGPGPGGKAMASAPTLGLDGFCQKFLVWQDAAGQTYLSFNDLLALAERQGADASPALRVIDFRLNKTFGDALAAD